MAGSARRVNSRSVRTTRRTTERNSGRYRERDFVRDTYEDGNAVRRLSEYPSEEEKSGQRKSVSRQVRRNRARAKNIGIGYVIFLAAVSIATLFLCVNFLQQKATLTTQSETIAQKESELNRLKADNDAYYNTAMASVTLDDVKDAALNRLGMHYATESQIIYYSTDEDSYLRQYQDVPGEKQAE